MKVKNQILEINNNDVKNFFNEYSKYYNEENQYGIILNQADNKELAEKRDKMEKDRILPYLNFNKNTSVLDIACGMGRWADCIPDKIKNYCGIDFSQELIEIAKRRDKRKNFSYNVGCIKDLKDHYIANNWQPFNCILLAGVCQYLNEDELVELFSSLDGMLQKHAQIYLRVPIAVSESLSIKDHYSEKLKTNYNALYRTDKSYMDLINSISSTNPFKVIAKEPIYGQAPELNENNETVQYFYIIER